MDELIRQAFLHVEVIGSHVDKGHYDIIHLTGEIILPQLWGKLIKPGDSITVHLWPISEDEQGRWINLRKQRVVAVMILVSSITNVS